MEKRAKMSGVFVVLCFLSLIMMAGCAEKTVVPEQPVVPNEQALKEQALKEQALKEQALKEQALKEQALKEQALKEQALKEEELKKAKEEAVTPAVSSVDIEDIHFDLDKYNLSSEARATLEKLANWMRQHKDYYVLIEGNCDERGTNEYNLALGEHRADAAKRYLMDLGVDEIRIKTVSYGEERPLDPAHNGEAWAKNRRDHFVINITKK
jgi:peptidoglycan-associated lipoprotein